MGCNHALGLDVKWEGNWKAGRATKTVAATGSLLSESLRVGDIEDDGYLRQGRVASFQGGRNLNRPLFP